MMRSCILCKKEFKTYNKKIIIENTTYEEVVCKKCVNIEAQKLGFGYKDCKKAKIRYNIPDDKWKIHNTKYTTEWWINKYGKKVGLQKQKEWKEKTSGSLKRYITKYGYSEGTKKYNQFKKNCSIYNTHRKNKYGEEHYNTTLKNYKNRNNNTGIKYYLTKTNGDYYQAAKLLSERQSTSTLQKFIKRYGEQLGHQKYAEVNKKKVAKFAGKSKIEDDFFQMLKLSLQDKNIDFIELQQRQFFYFGDIDKNIRSALVDIYIPSKKIAIEFFGDYWHMNPVIYDENCFNSQLKMTAGEKWEKDSQKFKLLKTKFNIETKIIWELDFRKNKQKLITKLIEELWN